MYPSSRPSSRVLGGLALALCLLGLAAPAFAADPSCQERQAALASRLADLPKTYDAISTYPVDLRRAIFRTATPQARAELWTTQLQRILAERSNLTPAQVDVIQRALVLMTPELFAASGSGSNSPRAHEADLAALEREIRAAFEPAQAAGIFAVLGKSDSGLGGSVLVHKGVPIVPDGIQCSCSTDSDWCSGAYSCWGANCDQSGGCGTLWLYTCNGLCAQFIQ
ncbi:MAG TPA: bacteriocin fulvocin C-related protein [Thermoanaerobaculia bacterium]